MFDVRIPPPPPPFCNVDAESSCAGHTGIFVACVDGLTIIHRLHRLSGERH